MGFHAKYAPTSADEIIGQSTAVTVALNYTMNIDLGARPYSSMILTGPPGVGKTTLADTISVQLQCENLRGNRPCGMCQPCRDSRIRPSPYWRKVDCGACSEREIYDAFDDAYNHTVGVSFVLFFDEIGDAPREVKNEIRSRLETLTNLFKEQMHLPVADRHRLLQRRPVFIFATTEDKKRWLDSSLISRSKQIEFVPIAPRFIYAHLARIAQAEMLNVMDEVLWTIAIHAAGDMRKAVADLEELAALRRPITAVEAHETLGFIDEKIFLDVVLSIKLETDFLSERIGKLMAAASPTHIVKGLTNAIYHLFDHSRGKMRTGTISNALCEKYTEAANLYSLDELCYLIDLVRRPGFQQATKSEVIEASLYQVRHRLVNADQDSKFFGRIEPRVVLCGAKRRKRSRWIL